MTVNKKKKNITLEEIEQFVIDAGSDNLGVFGGAYEGGIHVQQIPDEIAPCILAIMESGHKVESYLEIGAASGGTTFIINHFFKPKGIILIDDNKHHKAGLRQTVLDGVNRREFIGSSISEEILDGVAGLNITFDLIFIDGDHHYPGVKMDTIFYLPYLRPSGYLALHDSALPAWGVMRVVRELKKDPQLQFVAEYVSQKHLAPCGLALFRKET